MSTNEVNRDLLSGIINEPELIKYLRADEIKKIFNLIEGSLEYINQEYEGPGYYSGSLDGMPLIQGVDYIPPVTEIYPIYDTLLKLKKHLDSIPGVKRLKTKVNKIIYDAKAIKDRNIEVTALKAIYNGEIIKRGDKVTKLYSTYAKYKKQFNRTAPPNTNAKISNKVRLFNVVIKQLTGTAKLQALKDLDNLRYNCYMYLNGPMKRPD